MYSGLFVCPNCGGYKRSFAEVTSSEVSEERERNFTEIMQPYRGGKLSREFVEAYPEKAKNYGSADEIARSDYVWKDLPGYGSRKVKASAEKVAKRLKGKERLSVDSKHLVL